MRIQIVEDDRTLSEGIRLAFQETGLVFTQSASLRQAKEDFAAGAADIVILDINLPDGSGYEYLRWLKERSQALVLILTANDMETDEVMGLTLGADDYMTKPFSLAVLRARIQLFRRRITAREEERCGGTVAGHGGHSTTGTDSVCADAGSDHHAGKREEAVYTQDSFRFDFARLEFTKDGKELSLSVNEQKLLRLFVENPGRLLTRSLLYDRLWGDGAEYVDENALSVTVNRLRRKLEDKKDGVTYIQTVYGQGYMWKKNKEEMEKGGQARKKEEQNLPD